MTTHITTFDDYDRNKNLAVAIRKVCANLRDHDKKEVAAIMGNAPSPVVAAIIRDKLPGVKYVGWMENPEEPSNPTACGVGGFSWLRKGVVEGWVLGSYDLKKIMRPLTRYIRDDIIPTIREAGCHRLQCQSVCSHEEAHRWLVGMGAKIEGKLEGYGVNGEDFYSIAWRF